MDPYGTHQRLLVKYLMKTQGSILELGCGNYSTPLIHEIAAAQGRNVLTLEHRLAWLNKFMHMQSDTHKLTHVANWDDWVPDCMYGLAFIDHAPAERRLPEIRRLLDLVEVFVIHDTEDPVYQYNQVLCVMELIETDITMKPWTTVACPRR